MNSAIKTTANSQRHPIENEDFTLPESWVNSALGEYLHLKNGFAFKSNSYVKPTKDTFPVIRISDIDGKLASDKKAVHVQSGENGFAVNAGDLLIAMSGATTGKIGVYNGSTPAYQNQRVGNLKLLSNQHGDDNFKNYLVKSVSNNIIKIAYGGAQPNISGAAIEAMEINLPPLAEQKVIADKLDELLAQVDTLKARLDAIPATIKRFRQSVLAAAVSGKLTDEWSAQELKLQDIADFQNGYAFKSEWFKKSGDYQVIKLGNIRDGRLALENSPAFIDANIGENYIKHSPSEGDILLGMTGTRHKKDYGFCCRIQSNLNILINQRVGRIIPDRGYVLPHYLEIFLRSELFRSQFFIGETGGVNQGNVGSKHIMSTSISLPPLHVQTKIVHQVEQLFTYADQVEQQVKNAQACVNQLTQSILAKAFRGELTEQWRKDNPELISGDNSATALLERIKAERAAAKPAKKKAPARKAKV